MPLFQPNVSFWCAAALFAWALFAGPSAAEIPSLPAPAAPLDRAHPLVGQIVAPDGRLSAHALADRAARSQFVLLGEKHDNPDHHALQAWVIEALVASGRRPAVAMEMLDTDQSPALANYRKEVNADAAGLGPALGWEARGWPDWTMYAPIAAIAFRADLPILPADLTRTAIRTVGRGGVEALPPGLGNELESSPRYDAAQSESLADELRASHCGHLPEASLPRMMEVQWSRDANMARVLRSAGRPAVLIAGAGHVRNDRAVPWHLRETVPEQNVLSVAFVEVQPGQDDPASYSQAGFFDVLWFTARVENEDPCTKFRDSLQRMRRP
jgi:uncharacterized iron-regulated protein